MKKKTLYILVKLMTKLSNNNPENRVDCWVNRETKEFYLTQAPFYVMDKDISRDLNLRGIVGKLLSDEDKKAVLEKEWLLMETNFIIDKLNEKGLSLDELTQVYIEE